MKNASNEKNWPELFLHCQRGDDVAFAGLYDLFAGKLSGYCRSLGETDSVDDIVQEVFVKFIKNIRALRPDTNLPAYLFTAARNSVLNWKRDRQTRGKSLREYHAYISCLTPTLQADEQVTELELIQRVNRVLQALGEQEREVLLLHTQGEMTFREIAQVLGIPQGTAASRYRLGLEKLRKGLQS
jgi:RNA polymerase sigma-70 factor (ECF subfamily)